MLLIIFMVIAPTMSVGLNAAVPQPSDLLQAVRPTDEISVMVGGNGTVRLNQEVVAVEALGERLRAEVTTNANPVLFVQAEKGLDFAEVAR